MAFKKRGGIPILIEECTGECCWVRSPWKGLFFVRFYLFLQLRARGEGCVRFFGRLNGVRGPSLSCVKVVEKSLKIIWRCLRSLVESKSSIFGNSWY